MNKYTNYAIHEDTYKLLFSNFSKDEDVDNSKEKLIKTMAFINIDTYTKRKIFRFLELLKSKGFDYKKFNYNEETKYYEYKVSEEEVINFRKLSDMMNFPNNKELEKELTSSKRYKKCHLRSCMLAQNTENAYVLTGKGKLVGKNFLHSVVELIEDDTSLIIDWPRNLVMKKEDYINLLDFEIYSTINGQVLDEEFIFLASLFPKLNSDVYLAFRNEIFKDLEKNIDMFSEKNKLLLKR